MSETILEAGQVLAHTYELVSLIGRGGMGAVWEARHRRLPKRFAIKVLHQVPDPTSVAFARFRREAEITSRLAHPHIIEVLDFNVHPSGVPYIVMPLLEGVSLRQRMDEGPIPLITIQTYVRQVGSALVAAHEQGVIHRDLKPGNVFLCRQTVDNRLRETVKVLDFGTSKILGSTSVQTAQATMIGTPQYMAPEQAMGRNDQVGPHTDQFALAALAYELLCGEPPFGTGHPAGIVYRIVHEEPLPIQERVPALPPELVAALHRALAKAPEDRFPSVRELVRAFTGDAAFEEANTELAVLPTACGAAPLPPVEVPTGPSGAGSEVAAPQTRTPRHRRVRLLAWASLLLAAALAVGIWQATRGPEPSTGDPPVSETPARPADPDADRNVPLESAPPDTTPPKPEPPAQDAAPPSPVAAPPDAGAPAPPVADEDPDVVEPAATEASPTTAGEPADADATETPDATAAAPTPRSPRTSPKAPRIPSASSADKAAAEADAKAAEQLLRQGQYRRAIHMAQRSTRTARNGRAAAALAKAYCGLHDLGGARGALYKVPRSMRRGVKQYCAEKGVVL